MVAKGDGEVKAFYVVLDFMVAVICIASAHAIYVRCMENHDRFLAKFFAVLYGSAAVAAIVCAFFIANS
jgi:hypothetical protein